MTWKQSQIPGFPLKIPAIYKPRITLKKNTPAESNKIAQYPQPQFHAPSITANGGSICLFTASPPRVCILKGIYLPNSIHQVKFTFQIFICQINI